jgi:integrase
MPIDDTWYRRRRGPDNERIRSAKYGRGKRWRVRYVDGHGERRERMFERKADAEDFDDRARAGTAEETRVDQSNRQATFRDYGERWRLAREIGWELETRKRVESNLRCHLYPAFGAQAIRAITPTTVLEWLSRKLLDDTPKSSLKLYFELLDAVLAAAVVDRATADNPCDGVKLAQVLRGLSREPKWIPSRDEVLALFEAVPDRYRAILWLGAGEGLRISEALAFEDSTRCLELDHHELHVVQQLRYAPREYGGFYLSRPKSGSSGTIDLDPAVARALKRHMINYPPTEIVMLDTTGAEPAKRAVPLLFTTTRGNPFTDRTWSNEWIKWRDQAGWPKEHGGFHALRHFFATTLISNNAEPKDVQRALRHKTLQITLETYVHWWPRRERRRGIIGQVLADATEPDSPAEL